MTGSVLSTGDGHQGWQDKLSIMMVLELSICLKTGAMTLKTVLDKGYGSRSAGRKSQVAADCWLLSADGSQQHHCRLPSDPRRASQADQETAYPVSRFSCTYW